MRKDLEWRVNEVAIHLIDTNGTVRSVAKQFGYSKTTIHKDLVERLPEVSKAMAEKVRIILNKNTDERHIRGGLATQSKYKAK